MFLKIIQKLQAKFNKSQQKGFTLLEILLVIALIAILAGLIVVAINPAKQLTIGRNLQRSSDVNTILNAVYQDVIDGNALPSTIPAVASCQTACQTISASNEICRLGATGTCSGGVALTVLTTNAQYLGSIPADPKTSSVNGTGYYICKDSTSGTITVCAPSTETVPPASAPVVIYATK